MSDNNLSFLAKYFRGGSAEAEKDIRGEVFVPPGDINSLLDFEFHSSVILLGNKGVGKSIFVTVLHEAYLANNELSVLLTPGDIECDPILAKKTLSDRKSIAYAQLLNAIAGKIGKYSNENEVAVTSEVTALQKLALEEGYSRPDLVSKLASILAKALPKGGEIAQQILKEQARELGRNNLAEVVDRYLVSRNKSLWLFLDDIDIAGAKNDQGAFDYAACWAIVSAAVELSEDIPSLKCVISVRSDIWHLMTRTHRHGTERKDKLGQIHELKFTEEELNKIFRKRLELAARDAKKSDIISPFFSQQKINLPGKSEARRFWDKWITKTARHRPRDLVKFTQMLIQAARRTGNDVIGDAEAHSIMQTFGLACIENIQDEYGQICPQIREVIKDLTAKNYYEFVELMDVLKKMPSKRATLIDGVAMQATNEHAIQLLRLLHMACFLNPRADLDDEYMHFNYNDYPFLVDMAKYNDLQKYTWQIHPTFHSYAAEERKKSKFLP